jgi:hypothetical protein
MIQITYTQRLQLAGYSWNFVKLYFLKSLRSLKVTIKINQVERYPFLASYNTI